MPGLVTEGPHPQHAAQGAPQNHGEAEGFLRNAPGFLFRPPLVHTHEDKGDEVYRQKIQAQQLTKFIEHGTAPFLFLTVYQTEGEKARGGCGVSFQRIGHPQEGILVGAVDEVGVDASGGGGGGVAQCLADVEEGYPLEDLLMKVK